MDKQDVCHAFTVFPVPWLNDKNSTANFVSLGLSGNIFFSHACTSFPTWTQKLYHAVEGRKAEKLFSLIYGLSLTIMKDIQGVFWGCPRIEALF